MNPELQRNLWLELSPRRVIMMSVVVGLILFAAGLAGGEGGAAKAAEYLFYIIVVVWGTRNAAQSVVGEIRDRTWDSQRLSAMAPFPMTWGKLFGSTAFTWFGGAICLVVLVYHAFATNGAVAALLDLGYFLSIGLMAQTVALFASLLAVRRRSTHSRLDVFLYWIAGLAAAIWVHSVWQTANPGGAFGLGGEAGLETIMWWGQSIAARVFYLSSLVAFFAWALVGCYRLMRLELHEENGPLVWLGFCVFMALYMAGFDLGERNRLLPAAVDVVSMRLALAMLTLGALTYVAIFAERKDRVLYRWLGDALKRGHLGAALMRLQAWMVAYIATVIVAVLLVSRLGITVGEGAASAAIVLAVLGFLTRDLAVFHVYHQMPGRRRGDLGAVVTLFVLYVIAPRIVSGLGFGDAGALFYPITTEPPLLGAAIAWGEALLLWLLAFLVGRAPRTAPAATPA